MKLLGAFAIVIGASLAVWALLGFLVTPWINDRHELVHCRLTRPA
jgi:hypothetical protein